MKHRSKQVITILSIFLAIIAFTLACGGSSEPTVTSKPTAKEIPPASAAFQITELAINPARVNPGENVTITAKVTNTGDTEDNYTAGLRINNVTEASSPTFYGSKEIIIAAGASQPLSFVVSRDTPGTYKVTWGELTGEFVVVKPDEATVEDESSQTDKIQLGMYQGRVTYDPEEDYYFIEARGARFPFKTDPREALKVPLEAPGEDILAKHSALLLGMIGKEVLHITILINPDEEDEVMPAVNDLALYLQIANPRKFAGVAYTKPGGKRENSVVKGPQIQSLDVDATPETTIVQIKGPKSGAQSMAVRVLGDGKFIIEGETYEEVYLAADFVSVTLLKMLCGSADCPDAAACATGGDCGC